MASFSDFWTKVMSGADNQTPAVGRYLAMIEFMVFLVIIPVGFLFVRHLQWMRLSSIVALLTALPVYVGGITISVISLIRVTAPTEPKQRDRDND